MSGSNLTATVEIVDDTVVENTESFNVVFTPLNPLDYSEEMPVTTVSILDDDCELASRVCGYMWMSVH